MLAAMIVAGLLVNAQQLLGKDRYLFLTTDEVRLAVLVREQTDPHAVFLVATQHNHPVPVLAGHAKFAGRATAALLVGFGQTLEEKSAPEGTDTAPSAIEH